MPRLSWNHRPLLTYICNPLQLQNICWRHLSPDIWGGNGRAIPPLGSITSRCPGRSPRSFPELLRGVDQIWESGGNRAYSTIHWTICILKWGTFCHTCSLVIGYIRYTTVMLQHILSDSDIFYAVIHEQLHACWCIDGEVWQGIVTKRHILHGDLKHINLLFTRSRKPKDVEIVGAEIYLINSVLVRNISIRNQLQLTNCRCVLRDVRKYVKVPMK